jgi:hypothetical protein
MNMYTKGNPWYPIQWLEYFYILIQILLFKSSFLVLTIISQSTEKSVSDKDFVWIEMWYECIRMDFKNSITKWMSVVSLLFVILLYYFYGVGVWTQDFILDSQMVNHLSHALVLLCFSYFLDRDLGFFWPAILN